MEKSYSIIIPIYNEIESISPLLDKLKYFNELGHEIVIVDDGSVDGSTFILEKNNFINLIALKNNEGKGNAIKKGLKSSKYDKIILYDGDLELSTIQIEKLMVLKRDSKIHFVLSKRVPKIRFFSVWDIGNFIFTKLFNIMNGSDLEDALCCAKSFYKSDLDLENLKSTSFDIDVEISTKLLRKHRNPKIVSLDYIRRYRKDGKKLALKDSLTILKRILNS